MTVLKAIARAASLAAPFLLLVLLGWSVLESAAGAVLFSIALHYIFGYFVMRRPQPPARLVYLPSSLPDTSTAPREEKYCVVGAGFAGLSVCAALKRSGVPFDCLEQDKRVGGNWHQSVYPGVHIISSKKTTEYGDFPMPESFPDFPSAAQVMEYLHSYCEHFRLRSHIEFGVKVEKVDPIDGGRRYVVQLANGDVRTYKGVVVCNGHDWCPRIPSYPGIVPGDEKSNIEAIHSRHFKDPEQLRGKRVLVIGGGNSGCDIAVAAAEYAASSAISLRRGYWFLPRTMLGRPTVEIFQHWLPFWVQDKIIRFGLWTVFGSYRSHGLQEPDYNFFDHPVSVSCSMLQNIRLGRIAPYPAVERFSENCAHFKDGRSLEVDLVIYATGYHVALPMMSHLVEFRNGIPQMLNGVTHPTLRHLFMFGLGQARYGAGPLFTAGAKVLAETIVMQDCLSHPVGVLLKQMGARPKRPAKASSDVIIDPHVAFAQAMIGSWLVKALPYFERYYFGVAKEEVGRPSGKTSESAAE